MTIGHHASAADQKRRLERSIFEAFCRDAGFEVIAGSIQQPDPPAPDLIAEIERWGRVAFELVRIDDDDEFMGRSHLLKASEFYEREFNALPPARHEAIAQRYDDAEITIEFRRTATVRERKEGVSFVLKLLERLGDGVSGQLDLNAFKAPLGLESLWIIRAEKVGRPRFRSFVVGRPLPVQSVRITDNEPLPRGFLPRLGLARRVGHHEDTREIPKIAATGVGDSRRKSFDTVEVERIIPTGGPQTQGLDLEFGRIRKKGR